MTYNTLRCKECAECDQIVSKSLYYNTNVTLSRIYRNVTLKFPFLENKALNFC